MQVKVTVNERGALRNGRFAFTDRFTLVTELLQNSRRAGATQVWLTHDAQAKILTVEDDGGGIADFQKLLTINESGWDAATQEHENAFGVGFSNVLYAAKRCTIQSRGLSMVFGTDAALNQEAIDVVDDSKVHPYRTRIVLEGVDLSGLERLVHDLVRGFPLAVTFNGALVPRPHSESAMPFTETPIGKIHMHGRDDGHPASGTHVYLQGFCVHRPHWSVQDTVHVVHLDPRRFIARLPDRRVLIDEDEQLGLIFQAQRDLWRTLLLKVKTCLPAELFCDRYWDIARTWLCQDVFDDVPALPGQVCSRIGSYPIQTGHQLDSCLVNLQRPLPRYAVEQGEVQVADLNGLVNESMPRWMFAFHKNLVLVHAHQLHEKHWVHPYVRKLGLEDVAVEAIEAGVTAVFNGRWIDVPVQLCERVLIRMGEEQAEIADAAVWDGDVLFVPKGEGSGIGVQQVSSYVDGNDQFHEDSRDADCNAFATLIARLRYTDPLSAFESILKELELHQYPLICGRDYLIRIGPTGEIESLSLVDAVQ